MIATAVVATPLIAALLCTAPILRRHGRWVNAVAALISGSLALVVLGSGTVSAARAPWIPTLGAGYHVELDPLGAIFVACSSLLFAMSAVMSRGVPDARAFHALLAVLAGAVGGVIVARDLFLLFTFWELALIPIALLGMRWGRGMRLSAIGGVLVLDAVLLVAFASIAAIRGSADMASLAERPLAPSIQVLPLLLVLPAVAARLGVFPLHAVTAPLEERVPDTTAGFAVGALVFAAFAVFVRVAVVLFPDALAAFAPGLVAVAAIGVAYSAAVATRRPGARAVSEWIGRSQRNVAALGLLTATLSGLGGAALVLVATAPSVAAVVAAAGVARRRPASSLVGLAALAGAPLTGGFAGVLLVLATAYVRYPVAAAVAASAFALWAIAVLPVAREELGPPRPPRAGPRQRDALVLVPLLAFVVAVGVAPSIVTDRIPPEILGGAAQR